MQWNKRLFRRSVCAEFQTERVITSVPARDSNAGAFKKEPCFIRQVLKGSFYRARPTGARAYQFSWIFMTGIYRSITARRKPIWPCAKYLLDILC